MATVNDILKHPVPFTYVLLLFFPAHTHTNTPVRCVSCWHLLVEWKAALAETMGVYPAHVGLLSFVLYRTNRSKSRDPSCLPFQQNQNMQGCLCVHLPHFEYTKQPHLTNGKRKIAKCGLKTLHISLILLGFFQYVHYVETVLFTVPLRPIYVIGLCYTYLNVPYGAVHQGGLNSSWFINVHGHGCDVITWRLVQLSFNKWSFWTGDWVWSCERYIEDQVLLEKQENPVFHDMPTLIFIFVPCFLPVFHSCHLTLLWDCLHKWKQLTGYCITSVEVKVSFIVHTVGCLMFLLSVSMLVYSFCLQEAAAVHHHHF